MNYHTPSKSSKGGTTIYVNKDFDSLERSDIDINVIEFGSTWIEKLAVYIDIWGFFSIS